VAKLSAVVAVVLLFPPAAGAHLRTGTVAVDFRARLVTRPVGPVSVGVYQSDRAIHLRVQPGHSALVYGYLGDPLLRVGRLGSAAATSSPTAQAARVTVNGRSAVWHDVRTSNVRWSIPIRVDGRLGVIAGVTERLTRPTLWLWLAITAAVGLGVAATRSAAAAGLVSATAAIAVALGFALSAYASPGTWIAGLDELAFAAAGAAVLRFGPRAARVPAALWLSLVGLAVGLSKGEVFLHAFVLSTIPGTATRVLAAGAIGAGIAGGVLSGVSYLR
jgi:hypothetical protein